MVEDKNGHVLVGVKDNRKTLKCTINDILKNDAGKEHPEAMTYVQNDKGHGRIECRTIELIPITPEQAGYPHIQSAMRVKRERQFVRAGNIERIEKETSWYVATFPAGEAGAQRALALIRGHWGIENRLHHVKDVSMNEDRYRAKGGLARIMTAIRSVAALTLKYLGLTAPVAQMRFASKPALFTSILNCKSLEKFKLCFLG